MKKSLWVVLIMLFLLMGCAGDSSSGSSDSDTDSGSDTGGTDTETQVLEQLTTNTWKYYQSTDGGVAPSNSIAVSHSNSVGGPVQTASVSDVTTYFASGLMTGNLRKVFTDGTNLFVSELTTGTSYLALSDISNPKGKISNYTGQSTDLRFGASGFAKRDSDGKVFAWYGNDIVDVVGETGVFSEAPDYTHSGYGTDPADRFVIDGNGDFWVGTSNQESDGSLRTAPVKVKEVDWKWLT